MHCRPSFEVALRLYLNVKRNPHKPSPSKAVSLVRADTPAASRHRPPSAALGRGLPWVSNPKALVARLEERSAGIGHTGINTVVPTQCPRSQSPGHSEVNGTRTASRPCPRATPDLRVYSESSFCVCQSTQLPRVSNSLSLAEMRTHAHTVPAGPVFQKLTGNDAGCRYRNLT